MRFFLLPLLVLLMGFGASRTSLYAQPAAPPPPAPKARTTNITLNEIWRDYKFIAQRVPGFNFMANSNHYSRIDQSRVQELDFASGEITGTLFDYVALRLANAGLYLPETFDGYTFSADQQKLLITTNKVPIYRHSSKADFYIYDRKTQQISELDSSGQQMYATFSPDGQYIAYVRDNNLYVKSLSTGLNRPITRDGKKNAIINGATDWVYEEEFALDQAFIWSPDSKSILFLRFDESAVPEYTMEIYKDDLYPEYVTWKYPKVGETNSTVTAHVYELASAKTRKIFDTKNGNTHIPRIYWTPGSKPVVWVTNRHQDSMSLRIEKAPGHELETLLAESSKQYLDVHDDLTFLEDGSFLWTSDRSGFTHLYHYDSDGKLIKQLTKGNYPVTEFYGYDASAKTLYYQAAMTSPMRREVYRLPLKGGNPQAISTELGWNDAVFSANFSGYMLSHSSANTPPSFGIYNNKGKLVRALIDNAEIAQTQVEEGWRPLEFWSFKTVDGTELNGWRITPAGFSESANIAYPLFMFQYSGPGSQKVVDSWEGQNHWWFQMLVQQGYVVACVDPRGTGARGADFQKQTYLELGKLEVEDQIAAALYLGAQPWIDATRIGIFGWSYGGYMSSLCITKGADVFKLAIAVAPVTNWKWYDTLYTERYMRTTAENPEGFRQNSPVYFADKLKGHYLLVHGMGDDNVHFQHSVEMVNALVAANKDFEFQAYPNRNHGIYGGVTRLHLYERMTEFINQNL